MTEHFVTKQQLESEINTTQKRLEEVVRKRTTTIKGDILHHVNRHIDTRFEKAKEQRDESHSEILEKMKELSDKISPIHDNYLAVGKMGKWIVVLLTFITILVTAAANAKSGLSNIIQFFFGIFSGRFH